MHTLEAHRAKQNIIVCCCNTGEPQRPGPQICLHPSDLCHTFLWGEGGRGSKDRLWNAPQHQPLCVRDAVHALGEEARGSGGAVQEAHHPDQYVCLPAPIPAFPAEPRRAGRVPGVHQLCRMITRLFTVSVGNVLPYRPADHLRDSYFHLGALFFLLIDILTVLAVM